VSSWLRIPSKGGFMKNQEISQPQCVKSSIAPIKFGEHLIGPGYPPFLIVEIGQAHDGSLGTAHAFIDIVADSGADAIKFQTHIAECESTRDEPFRVTFSRQDKTRYDYWKRTEFTEDEWKGLADHAREQGLVFLSSAFSVAAVALLDSLGIPAWKVGSGEFRSLDLIDCMLATGKPIFLSTGMSRWSEIGYAVDYIRNAGGEIGLFQCTSEYPTSLNRVGLNIIDEMRSRYECILGLSDHSGTVWPSIAAMARGIDLLEVHLTLHKKAFGPDVAASLTPDELKCLVEARDAYTEMDGNPVDKDMIAEELAQMRELFTKSVSPVRELKAGEVLEPGMLTLKKPGTGISADKMEKLYGRKLVKDVARDSLLQYIDLDGTENR